MPRKKTEERRRAILDTSCRLFGTRGYQATSIADIAAELGMGHGTFYRYFRNKRDIFEHVVGEVSGRIAAAVLVEDPTAATTAPDYGEQVERIARSLLRVFLEDAAIGRLIFYEALGLDDAMRGTVERAFDLFGTVTARYLQNGVDKGFLRPDLDVRTTSLMLNAMLLEGARRALRADDPDAEGERWIHAARTLMFEGMAPADVPTPR